MLPRVAGHVPQPMSEVVVLTGTVARPHAGCTRSYEHDMRWILIALAACATTSQPVPTLANRVAPQFELRNSRSAIQGIVADAKTHEPLAGVTVVVTSPAMIGSQFAITDDTGGDCVYHPPGPYVGAVYFTEPPGAPAPLSLRLDKT